LFTLCGVLFNSCISRGLVCVVGGGCAVGGEGGGGGGGELEYENFRDARRNI